jgi:hypothetical protein
MGTRRYCKEGGRCQLAMETDEELRDAYALQPDGSALSVPCKPSWVSERASTGTWIGASLHCPPGIIQCPPLPSAHLQADLPLARLFDTRLILCKTNEST